MWWFGEKNANVFQNKGLDADRRLARFLLWAIRRRTIALGESER
jgi:hypothetical protein